MFANRYKVHERCYKATMRPSPKRAAADRPWRCVATAGQSPLKRVIPRELPLLGRT
jgi:hypothetical protein